MNDARSTGSRLLLMGSSAFTAEELPTEVKERIDDAIARSMMIIVGEARGACRAYQGYLKSKAYGNVIVGHALSLRYNAGNWKDRQYGKNVEEREKGMIEDCDEAIVIWVNQSGVIAGNLELLRRLGKPTFLYEYSTETNTARSGPLDPTRIYDSYYYMKQYYRKRKHS